MATTSPSAHLTDTGEPDSLSGEVVAVIFANAGTGFGVVELTGDDDAEGARASGPLAELVPGQPVRLLGAWTEHQRYGPTFAAVAYEHAEPRSTDGLKAFLASPRFPGVGEVIASRLVEAFGLELGAAIEADPAQLARVAGVSPALAERIAAAWAEAGALAALVRRLSAAGLPATIARAVHRHFGDDALEVIDTDPYGLLAVRGVGWMQVERLARDVGIAPDDPRRLAAGAVAAHRDTCRRHGHVALTDAELRDAARRLLRVGDDLVNDGIARATQRGALVRDEPSLLDDVTADAPAWWYAPADLAAERALAADLRRLLTARSRVAAAARVWTASDELTEEQRAAIEAALRSPVSVLTGGPGTGKTRAVSEIVAACEDAGLNLALCAPTGRAAKRLEEVTGHGATTVHRLLDARPDDRGFRFGYGPHQRLPHDVVVADEWSMADLHLAAALAAAIEDGAHLVLVGDADQLPSVGAGAVLRDLLDPRMRAGGVGNEEGASGAADGEEEPPPVVHATRLETVHRQAAESRIVTLAHEINEGRVPPLSGRDRDVFVVSERSAQIAERVGVIVAERAPRFFGCGPGDVQVLAPMYRGAAGVDALNHALKLRLNPPAERPAVGGFHEGDRVVQTRNDADLDVANGDIGEVVATAVRDRTVEVAFAHAVVTYPAERVEDLRPAWCLTVHKAQGGEWPVVVLVLDRSHRVMLWRELVYTAVTRAQQGLLLVGDASLVGQAAARLGSGARRRHTRLVERLVGEP